jgi:hypothetical protein
MPIDPAKLLKDYQDKGYNILTPSITLDGLSEHHYATIETIQLSHKPDDGDVYKHQSGGFIISKQGLDKLAVLADIIWDKDECKRLDDPENRNYFAFQAFGAIKKADGKYVPAKGYKDMDMLVEREELDFKYLAKGKKANKTGQELEDYINYCVKRDMIHKRKFGPEMCESGAKNRVIRALLGIKKAYTVPELQKPFVVIKITYQPDYDDPEIKKLMTYLSVSAQTNVFGGLPPAPPALEAPKSPSRPKSDYTDAVVVEGDDTPEPESNGIDPDDEIPFNDSEIPFEEDEAEEDQFDLWDRKSQDTHITKLAKEKSYNLAGLLKRMKVKELADLSDIQILQVYDNLKKYKKE